MQESSDCENESPLFAGVVFLLAGFDPLTETQLTEALERNGGINVGKYDVSCTHVIVSRSLLWDDAICAAARKDGKMLITEVWVSDCLTLGGVVDVNNVIYKPLRDPVGISGSKNLVVCLTGYQGQARWNVMRMVQMMGAVFSKPLIANKVTHLICYKFEGEKYCLAKQLGLKLVNHRWLEDCLFSPLESLKEWFLLPEEDYLKSGLELELLEAQAKDSEDDACMKLAPTNDANIIAEKDATCHELPNEEVIPQLASSIKKFEDDRTNKELPDKFFKDEGSNTDIMNQKNSEVDETNAYHSPVKNKYPVIGNSKSCISDNGSCMKKRGMQTNAKGVGNAFGGEMHAENIGSHFVTPEKTKAVLELQSSKELEKRFSDVDEERKNEEPGSPNGIGCQMRVKGTEERFELVQDLNFQRPTPDSCASPKEQGKRFSLKRGNNTNTRSATTGKSTLVATHKCQRAVATDQSVLFRDEEDAVLEGTPPSKVIAKEKEPEILVKQDESKLACTNTSPMQMGNLKLSKTSTITSFQTPANCTPVKEHEKNVCKEVQSEDLSLKEGNSAEEEVQPNCAPQTDGYCKIDVKVMKMDVAHATPKNMKKRKAAQPSLLEDSPHKQEQGLQEISKSVTLKKCLVKKTSETKSKRKSTRGKNPAVESSEDQEDGGPTENCSSALLTDKVLDQMEKNSMSKPLGKVSKDLANNEHKTQKMAKQNQSRGKENAAASIQGSTERHLSKKADALTAVNRSDELIACTNGVLQKRSSNKCFALSGHRDKKKPLQVLVKKLGGRLARDSHQWSYQTTHLVIAGPLRRTEKLFAAAAGGRWILKEDYLKDSDAAGAFLDERKYEWHGSGMNDDGSISLESPRKWRELRECSGLCALEGLNIVVYGECIIPSLDTLKRATKAGGGNMLAVSPPYTRFLSSGVDFAIVSPGTPKEDFWIQQFLGRGVACVTTDFLVDFVCKSGSSLDRHVLYDTHCAVHRVVERLHEIAGRLPFPRGIEEEGKNPSRNGQEPTCSACGKADRDDVMLLCGDEKGSGCRVAMHIDCCNPPLAEVPAENWYCAQCSKPEAAPVATKSSRKKRKAM